MDEVISRLDAARETFQLDNGVHWIPVRHHSPACAYYLEKLLDLYKPDILLIEGSVDFNDQVSALTHPQTRAPVALYSANSFYPLCETSPEWRAIQWGALHNKQIQFIDLPVSDKAWLKENENSSRISYLHEANLQHSEFVKKLVKKTACRNSDELWERQFELKEFDTAESFFQCVFEYCVLSRLTYSEQALVDSGDIARELHMRNEIIKYANKDKTCFVITGGFHTLALLDYSDSEHTSNVNRGAKPEPTWLIRYSLDRLDSVTGYNAGMQAPEFHERLYHLRTTTGDLQTLSESFVLDSLAKLSQSTDFPTEVNTAAKLVVCEQALNLARLRGNFCPGLHDIKDALQSVLIKKDMSEYELLLTQAHKVLAGDKLGNVSTDQPPLPLVNELYRKLQQARFKLDSTSKVTTRFSLYKSKEKIRSRLALLNQCVYLNLDFANKLSGPDWIHGQNLHLQNEEWQYAWTPWVEARLVDLSDGAADWKALLSEKIMRTEMNLSEKSLVDNQQFFVQLVLMDCLDLVPDFCHSFNNRVVESTDCEQLSSLLFLLLRLRQNEAEILASHMTPFDKLIAASWAQLVYSLPKLNQDELDTALQVLIHVQELTREFESYLADDWKQSWVSRLQWLIEFAELRPGLLFACYAILVELGESDETELFDRLKKLLLLDADAAYEALSAMIKVNPHWLLKNNKNSIIGLLNTLISQWSEDQFLAMLPELRFLFSHLDPAKVEQMSAQICVLNNWEVELELFQTDVNERDVIEAQRIYQSLLIHLEERGLQHWMKD